LLGVKRIPVPTAAGTLDAQIGVEFIAPFCQGICPLWYFPFSRIKGENTDTPGFLKFVSIELIDSLLPFDSSIEISDLPKTDGGLQVG
jgi:hypothetical protein